jgi:hypothetical protein
VEPGSESGRQTSDWGEMRESPRRSITKGRLVQGLVHNNGILEGINSLVQAAKAKARGYRSNRNFATIIYLIAGKLDLSCQPT